jgi:hypothetical protein
MGLVFHWSLLDMAAIAGLGHLITLVREKYLPCSKCTKESSIEEFKIV